MNSKSKNISNPYSTGSGGPLFEAHVQASFVTLMLTGGYAPCLPCWPITEIILQGKVYGFETDDLIVSVNNHADSKGRKLLGQVKSSIAITESSATFSEVIQAAWNDFNNPNKFSKGCDIIALIVKSINKTDENLRWLLNFSRHREADDFFTDVKQALFSSDIKREKLKVILGHLKNANNGIDIKQDIIHSFLKHFYLLSYDLGEEFGVVLSLLHSHMSQAHEQSPQWIWPRVVEFVQNKNQYAGKITLDNLPNDLRNLFKLKKITHMPEDLSRPNEKFMYIDMQKGLLASHDKIRKETYWSNSKYAIELALLNLIGSWDESNDADIKLLEELLETDYKTWFQKARMILDLPDSPLTLNKKNQWKLSKRPELWDSLGSQIFDVNLDTFKELALTVLKESDPAFELPPNERYAAAIYGKVLTYSPIIRTGIADGLAILGNNPHAYKRCSLGKVEAIAKSAIRELLTDANDVLWGSLGYLVKA